MHLLVIISSIFITLYILHISLYIFGFIRLKTFKSDQKNKEYDKKKYLSVIIPFKNEEKNINKLLIGLSNQTLDPDLFEIIFVNDNSVDKSEQIINSNDTIRNYKICHTDSDVAGKKNAVHKGITEAVTNLIVTTDADCTQNKRWLETVLNYYIKYKPKMIISPVVMKGNNLFENIQSLEFLSLIASTAGATELKHPIMCNGANLAYEKKIYIEIEDALNFREQSGDDIFLLHKIKKKYLREIHYLKSKDATVYSEAEKTFKMFLKQRIRWASKSKSYKDLDSIVSSLLVFITNLILTALFIISIFENSIIIAALWFMILKIIPDLVLLILSANYFKIRKLLIFFPLTALVYPVYIVGIAVSGFLMKRVSWK